MNRIQIFVDQLIENRTSRHVLFWLGTLAIAPLFGEYTGQGIREALIYRVVGMPIKIVATYLLVYYQIPRLLQRKRYFQFLISFATSAYLFCIIYRLNNVYIAEPLAGQSDFKESLIQILIESKFTIYFYLVKVYGFTLFFMLFKYIRDRGEEKRKVETLLKEKANTELNFLKAQIHPHFLFNTLNNLYALTLDKSDDAPEVVAKLSEILDYMLYQCNDPEVLLQKEIELIQYYIDLEKLRYGERLQLQFKHQISNPAVKIAPLVLLSIVENAFKHGVSGAIENPKVDIHLKESKGILTFEVYNTKPNISQVDEKAYRKGIGTSNIKRQLQLVYPDHHEWIVDEKEKSYLVYLSIAL
ncbi:MAG: sensor histidine kinase [Bacteroidota bacterium]